MQTNWFSQCFPASLQSRSEKITFSALAGSVSLGLASIAVSQIFLAAALVGYFWLLRKRKEPAPPLMGILLPLISFALWTLVAVFASSDIHRGLSIVKKFYLYLLILAVPLIIRGAGRVKRIYCAIFLVAFVSAIVGAAQYAMHPHRDLLHRITGFMGHWMTYSGLLMLSLVLLAAYAFSYGTKTYKWAIPAAAMITAALLLSETRSALLGAVVGIFALALLRRPKMILILAALVVIGALLSPSFIKKRYAAGFDPADPNTRNRIELIQTSKRLIRDNPIFGVGPKLVSTEALRYRATNEFPDGLYIHMHNNFLQIAAETGIPGLVLWLWLMGRLAWDAIRCFRAAKSGPFFQDELMRKEALLASSAAIASWIAFIVAGMFEYNFGNSEVLALFLFIMSSPYAFLANTKEAM